MTVQENKIFKVEQFYKKIPKLYSEYVTLDYQSTELLNEVFEIYEKFVINFTKNDGKNRGACVPSISATPKKPNEQEKCNKFFFLFKFLSFFSRYFSGLCIWNV